MRRDFARSFGAVLAPVFVLSSLAGVAACSKKSSSEESTEMAAPSAQPSGAVTAHPGMPPGHPGMGGMGGMPGAMPSDHAGMGGMAGMGGPQVGGPDISWDAPAAWTVAPNPSPMRKATYKIPKAQGDAEDAELAVSSAGGGVEANVDRWAKQFGDAKAKTEPRTVNGLKVTMVEIKGTFAGGGPMMGGAASAPKEKQMLLGAIVEQGDREHFFKMVGPEKTVTAARADFDKLVASVRAK